MTGSCCALSCGKCTESGCLSRRGGSKSCCPSKIRQINHSCRWYSAPCVIDGNHLTDSDSSNGSSNEIQLVSLIICLFIWLSTEKI
jgi:hypothetical protein